jgi:uncharacterized protein
MRTAIVVFPLLAAAAAAHAETPIPSAPDGFVTDQAGVLAPGAAIEIEARLRRHQADSGQQIIVYIDRTTGGAPIKDWAMRAFEKWRPGRRGIDDAAALFMFTDDRRLGIQVGYGLEDRIPDAHAERIIAEQIVPRMRAGDHDGAVRAGVSALIAAASSATTSGAAPAPGGGDARVGVWMVIASALVLRFLVGFLMARPGAWSRLAMRGDGKTAARPDDGVAVEVKI